jgi:hypothetical protein
MFTLRSINILWYERRDDNDEVCAKGIVCLTEETKLFVSSHHVNCTALERVNAGNYCTSPIYCVLHF